MSDLPTQDSPEATTLAPETQTPASPAAQSKPESHLTSEYRQHIEALIQGQEQPKEGTQELVDDLKECAAKQGEARKALQQASQFAQAKQAEIASLEGEATALMRVLKRAEG